jgi:hypothetical protein
VDLTAIPTRFMAAFASQAAPGDVTIPFPVVAQPSGLASLVTGFTPINFEPVAAGGVPPWGKDVNGILLLATSWEQWFQAGGPIGFDPEFAAAIGGYPLGATLSSGVGPGILWLSTGDANVTAPVADGTAWLPGVTRASSGRANAGVSTMYTYGGNPNGHLPGTAASATSPPDMCWDYIGGLLYACRVTGTAAVANWVAVTFTPSSYDPHRVILGSGTAIFNLSNAGNSGQPFVSRGVSNDPSFGALDLADGNNSVVNQLQVGWGGTGVNNLEFGALVVGNNTNPVNRVLATAPTGFPLLSVSGGIPQWSGMNIDKTYGALDLNDRTVGVVDINGRTSGAIDLNARSTGVVDVNARTSGAVDIVGRTTGILPANRLQRGSYYVGGNASGATLFGTFTVPGGVSTLKIRLWGAGGGGGGALQTGVGYGGGGGGYVEGYLAVNPGEQYGYQIGSGGPGGGVGNGGLDASNTIMAGWFAGGGRGGGTLNTAVIGNGGGAAGGNFWMNGQEGGTFWAQGGPLTGLFVAAGGGGTFSVPPVRPGAGGPGGNGFFPGGGGGGGCGTFTGSYPGGNGAPGLMIIEW